MGIVTASLSALRIDPAVRSKAGEALIPTKDMKVIVSLFACFRKTKLFIGYSICRSYCWFKGSYPDTTEEALRSPIRYVP